MKYALLLIVLILSACGEPPTPEPTVSPQESAWFACTTFIQQQLDISPSDAQDYSGSGVTTSGDQYTVEVFYADLASSYRCELLHHANGNWELQSLEVK